MAFHVEYPGGAGWSIYQAKVVIQRLGNADTPTGETATPMVRLIYCSPEAEERAEREDRDEVEATVAIMLPFEVVEEMAAKVAAAQTDPAFQQEVARSKMTFETKPEGEA
jgi:hypothetical protein